MDSEQAVYLEQTALASSNHSHSMQANLNLQFVNSLDVFNPDSHELVAQFRDAKDREADELLGISRGKSNKQTPKDKQ